MFTLWNTKITLAYWKWDAFVLAICRKTLSAQGNVKMISKIVKHKRAVG